MDFKQLKAHIKHGKLYPAYRIYGDDPYLVSYAHDMFLKTVSLPEFNISLFINEVESSQIINALSTMPLLADYRFVSVNLPLFKGDLADLKDYLCPSAVLLLLNGTKTPNIAHEAVICDRLDFTTISNYINSECRLLNCVIEPNALSLLVEYCSYFMGHITTNLSKLTAYSKTITTENVKNLVTPMLEYRVYELTDAISKRLPLKANQILDDMLSQSGGVGKTFGLIYSHFRKLMFASLNPNEKELSKALLLKEYACKQLINQATMFSKLKLKYFLDKLALIDYQTKNINSDKILLECFVYEASIRE